MMRSILCLFLVLFATPAFAATSSSQICTDATKAGQPAQNCINALKWDMPGPNDLVLTRVPPSTSEWDNTTIWAKFSTIAPPTQYRQCPLDLTLPAIHGGVNGVYVGDPCGSSQVWATAPAILSGQTVTVTCSAPDTNTDSSAIGPTQVPLQFQFYENLGPTGPQNIYRTVSPPQPACRYAFQGMENGVHYFQAVTIDAQGGTSDGSNVATKTVTDKTPSPPVINALTVLHADTAYQIVQAPNQVTLLAFGNVPAGTVCDPKQSAGDAAHGTMYLVPYTSVTMPNGTPNTTRKAVFAPCG